MMAEFTMYMKVGDVLVPIGIAEMRPTSPNHVNISGELDIFPGARLTFSRVVNWEEVLTYAQALHPDDFVVLDYENDGELANPTDEEKERIKTRVLEEFHKKEG
jgi:hypothetical protein